MQRMLWIGMFLLPHRQFRKGSDHSPLQNAFTVQSKLDVPGTGEQAVGLGAFYGFTLNDETRDEIITPV